jgi:NAD(P)H dehydrogenase (quinone)
VSTMLVIYAHPNKEGHCGSILRNVEKMFRSRHVDYKLIDLYKIGYDPVLKPSEHYSSGHTEVSGQNKSFQNDITNAGKIIFIYPTWWQNMPAILKGFIDRVFVEGFAFAYKGEKVVRLLRGKQAVVFTSTGASRQITRRFLKDRSTTVLAKDTLGYCGIKAKAFYVSDAENYSSDKEPAISALVKKGLS